MTRKDYERIAATIARMPEHAPSLRAAKASTARAFADELDKDLRFDRRKFMEACFKHGSLTP